MKLYLVTFPDRDALETVTDAVIEERLAACVNSFPVGSVYRWEGERKREGEVTALLKTSDEAADALEERLEELHPYDVPEILQLPVEANEAYADWVRDETE